MSVNIYINIDIYKLTHMKKRAISVLLRQWLVGLTRAVQHRCSLIIGECAVTTTSFTKNNIPGTAGSGTDSGCQRFTTLSYSINCS